MKDNERIYFAYGSNLLMSQMLGRCPHSIPLQTFLLLDYNLIFVGFESRWDGGVASITYDKNGKTPGALYQLTPEDEKKLDQFEGINSDIYHKKELEIAPIRMFTYICNHNKSSLPSMKYLNTIKMGYKDWNLSLETLSTINTCD